MILTLKHALEDPGIIKAVGSCDRDKKIASINEATQLLMVKSEYKNSTRRVKIHTCYGCVSLPVEFDKILGYSMDCKAGVVQNQYYEFMEGGPGRLDSAAWVSGKTLVDVGGYYPTFNDMDCEYAPLRLLAFSTFSDDTSLKLSVRGKDENLLDIMTDSEPGEEVPINQWVDGVDGRAPNESYFDLSPTEFRTITSIVKPETSGYITLYAYNPDWTDGDDGIPMLYFLGKYGPDETHPGYRRYQIPSWTPRNGSHIVARVKMAYVPAKYDNDVLLIQNLVALKRAIYAEKEYDTKNFNTGLAFEGQAASILTKQVDDHLQESNTINVQGDGWAIGDLGVLI